jgi:hypothetical protein
VVAFVSLHGAFGKAASCITSGRTPVPDASPRSRLALSGHRIVQYIIFTIGSNTDIDGPVEVLATATATFVLWYPGGANIDRYRHPLALLSFVHPPRVVHRNSIAFPGATASTRPLEPWIEP